MIDSTDRSILLALRRNGRASITELAKVAGVARGTVQTRLRRMVDQEVITGFGPDLDPAQAGFPVVAFTTLSILQGGHDSLVQRLRATPEVLSIHVVTGSSDLLCRVAAKSNDHLHLTLQQIVSMPEVGRAESQLALSTLLERSVADLVLADKGV